MSKDTGENVDQQARSTINENTGTNAQGVMFMDEKIQDPNNIAFAVAVLVGLLTLFLIVLWSRKGVLGRSSKNAIILAGPSDAGKTLLFSQLLYSKPIETFTSMIENVGQYSGGINIDGENNLNAGLRKRFHVYDLPGHDRLRYTALDKHKEKAKAVIYVIDASTIKQKLRDSAEFLFNVLRDPCLYSAGTPVLVVCNKQDLGLQAKGAKVIERELAKEIGLLRVTKSRLLQDSSGSSDGNSNIYLGQEAKDFEFSDLRAKVNFYEASAMTDCNDEESGIPAIKQWIASVA